MVQQAQTVCPTCNGDGFVDEDFCPTCFGGGTVPIVSSQAMLIKRLTERSDALDTKSDALDAKIDTLDIHLDTIETKIDALLP